MLTVGRFSAKRLAGPLIMMKRNSRRWLIQAIVATVGSVAALVGASRACLLAAEGDPSRPLGVCIRLRIDRSIPPRDIARQLMAEAEAIWRPYGIQLEWVGANTVEPRESGVSLDVERRLRDVSRFEWARVLGRTALVADTDGWRPIRVSFEAVANMLAGETRRRGSTLGVVPDLSLGRALGRVLAHEIGHVLISADHDRRGLMRAMLPDDQLGRPDRLPFRLTCETADQLRGRHYLLNGGVPVVAQADTHSCIR
jgi:hypothetical protein